MLNFLARAITSRAAGPVASALAVALAVALVVSWSGWETRRAGLERRVAELTRQAERNQSLLKAQLAACHAAAAEPRRLTQTGFGAAGSRAEGAQGLLEREPEGIDACARMESADQAVLSNLK